MVSLFLLTFFIFVSLCSTTVEEKEGRSEEEKMREEREGREKEEEGVRG